MITFIIWVCVVCAVVLILIAGYSGVFTKEPVDNRPWWTKDLSIKEIAGLSLGLDQYESYERFVEVHGDNLIKGADAWLYPAECATAQMSMAPDGNLAETGKISQLARDICELLVDASNEEVVIIGTSLIINGYKILTQHINCEWNTDNMAFTKAEAILFEYFINKRKMSSQDRLKQLDLDRVQFALSV